MRLSRTAGALLILLAITSCSDHPKDSSSSPPSLGTVEQGLDSNCFTNPSECLRVQPNKVTCYKPGTVLRAINVSFRELTFA
jgi:hypothetical protein